MRMIKEKKQLIILIISTMFLLCSIGSTFATNLPVTPTNNASNNGAIVDENNIPNLDYRGNNKDDNNSDNNSDNNNVTNTSTNATMPDTGLEEGSMVIIAICIISAIYAHKKIKDYNNF